ncbi:hypothetical protein CR513_60933, partial [Mucuna pruriens]
MKRMFWRNSSRLPEPRPSGKGFVGLSNIPKKLCISTRKDSINCVSHVHTLILTDENFLKMFRRVKINISLLDAIKHIPKYAKFLKELCMHNRKKIKGGGEMGRVVSALIKHEDVIAGS